MPQPTVLASEGGFSFEEPEAVVSDTHAVASGYDVQVFLRWGDPLFADSPRFDPQAQSGEMQVRQFGYDNDYVGYLPIDGSSERGLLVVNHENTQAQLMFAGATSFDGGRKVLAAPTKQRVDVEMAAHGMTIVQVERRNGRWDVGFDKGLNRRITATTTMSLAGPVAGSKRVQTRDDPTGRTVIGTINNCSGGITPWGTCLSGEENFNSYFSGTLPGDHAEFENHDWYYVGSEAAYKWSNHYDRFDVAANPTEPNRFGYVVEIDPWDQSSTPKKRTALGRLAHEGAACATAASGQVVVYMGDDAEFEHIYKFISSGKVADGNPDLLDEGTLLVARFHEDGTVEWLPLVYGQGPLTPENRFHSQADVLIETRRAADLLGSTAMDRPEGIGLVPGEGRVYAMLTGSGARNASNVNAANPRADGSHGHIIDIVEDGGDFAALRGTWTFALKAGDPFDPAVGSTFSAQTTSAGWFRRPDNCAVDKAGRLWVATDGNSPLETGTTDGLYAVDLEGGVKATSRLFFRVPIGAELTGPAFTPDGQTLFASVQHPGRGGIDWASFGRESYFEDPSTRWPDFDPSMPPRPSVVAITKKGGGVIGS
jgi:secreted PhoX family phosphatase